MADAPVAIGPDAISADAATASDENAEQDYGEWNEKLPDNLQKALLELDRFYGDEFRYPRRLEVMHAWKARSFWREMQHLHWNWDSEWWDIGGPAGFNPTTKSSNMDTSVFYTTNVFQGFGDAFIAIITQAVPNVRFEPTDPDDAADIETARQGESFRKIIQHQNDPIALMTRAAYFAWTDGRMHAWTREENDKRTNKPRVMQSIYGSMEVKVPVIYDPCDGYNYIQYSNEFHQSIVREKVKKRAFESDYWKKIKGGTTGAGQDVYERTARISVKQGISLQNAGGDAYSHLVTTRRSWFRPSCFFEECIKDEDRDGLIKTFPNGAYLESDNGVYTGSKDANMDDEWAVECIMEGDGSNRNGKGTCLHSVQERVNDTINTTQDSFEKCQPASHWDDKLFDVEGMKEQRSMPGARYGVNMQELPAGETLAGHVFFEEPARVDASQLAYLKELMTDIPEFLTGISAILFGSDTGGDKSGKALQVQQSAAMGRVGLSFRKMKSLYAKMMEQAMRCAAKLQGDLSIGIPDKNGDIETITVREEQLTGNALCYPDPDENYPETWVQQRATYMALLQDGNADPAMRAILSHPRNQELGKKLIGLAEFEIPDADSWYKQSAEINYMLEESAHLEQKPPMSVPNPLMPQVSETIQPPPEPKSSVPVDPIYDNHKAEFETVFAWVNSADGQKAKRENPEGFENIRLHGLEHKKFLMMEMAASAPPMPAPAQQETKKPKGSAAPPAPAAPAPPKGIVQGAAATTV